MSYVYIRNDKLIYDLCLGQTVWKIKLYSHRFLDLSNILLSSLSDSSNDK